MASVVATRRLAPLDWARHESTIRQLYVGDDMGLSAVRNKMANEFGFHASKSQFETQLKKWGLRKNHTSAVWKIIAHNLHHRQLVGKKTAVFFDGHLIPDVRVQREISRHGSLAIRKRQSQDCHSPVPRVPPRFSLRTPPPERVDPVENNNLPTMQLFQSLDSYYNDQGPYRPPLTRPAYINPELLTRAGDFASESWVPSEMVPFSEPLTSQLVRGDQLPISERRLQAILPLALHTSNLIGPSDEVSMAIQGSPFLYTPHAKLLLFGIANNFAGMEDLSYSDVWKSLKAKAGAELLKFLHQLPPSSQASRAVVEKLFQCAIEADDTAAVEILLKSPEIRINANEVVCRSHERGTETALEFAASCRQIQMVSVLLYHGADVNKSIESFDHYGRRHSGALARTLNRRYHGGPPPPPPPPPPPTRNVAEDRTFQLVDLLLRHGAVVDTSIISLALYSGSLTALERLLLTGGADDHIEWAKSGIFHRAVAFMGNEAAIRLCEVLVQNRLVLEILREESIKSPFWNFHDSWPTHFLDVVVFRQNISVAKMLLVEYDFYMTETTLTFAIQSGGMELVQFLLERGAMADPAPIATYHLLPKISYMATPLSEAIRFKRAGIVKLLEEHGALRQIKEATRYHAALVATFHAGNVGMANRLLELHGPHTPEILGYGLVEAIRSNQSKLALRLLELGASESSSETVDALSLAMQKRESKLIRALLDSPDIDFAARYATQFSPLFEAVKRGDRSLVMELIMAGAPVNAGTDSITPLIMAVRANDRELVELLLRFGASVNFSVGGDDPRYEIDEAFDDIVSSNENEVDSGENNIDVDSRESDIDSYENEVNYGENNVNFGEDDVYSDNDIDSDEGSVGSDEDGVSSDEGDVGPPPIEVMTPLVAGIMNGDIDMISFLLSNGADPSDASALAEAVYMKNLEIMDVLLDKFRESYPRGKAVYGLEAMRIAVRRGDLPLVAKLLANGIGTPLISALVVKHPENTAASLNAIVYRRRWDSIHGIGKVENETALLVAVKVQKIDKVQLLVEMGADVNRSTVLGVKRTPLQKAAEVGDFRISEYLINRGADFACIYGYAGIVDLLLQNGADLDAAPARSEGRTALEGAAEHGRLDIVAILLNAGIKVHGDHRPQFERAIERAQEAGHFAVVDLLVSDSRPSQKREPRDPDDGGSCLVTSESGFGEEFICWES
ncbi:ankyrin [Hyaloscypha bicolor E]|uniref:Ankyrin n=1 Tax=Hyaloscypha bicolor E TaxID=1095630 RepID=A0A2J6TAW1_9HELO|nr:ankyrin [Hyaloscypha bicolor E]PMD60174.1 ankyrin [Hyaloscypha bicolor E]